MYILEQYLAQGREISYLLFLTQKLKKTCKNLCNLIISKCSLSLSNVFCYEVIYFTILTTHVLIR